MVSLRSKSPPLPVPPHAETDIQKEYPLMWKHSPAELAKTLCVRPPTLRPLAGAAEADQTIDAFRARLQVTLFAFAAATNLNENAKTAVLVLLEDVAAAIRRLHPNPANTHVKETLYQVNDLIKSLSRE